MRFTTITASLLICLSGTLAASIPSADALDALLEKRDCSCTCVDACSNNCSAFGGTAGSQISAGLCLVTCGDSCGCGPTEVCNNKEKYEAVCKKVKEEAEDFIWTLVRPYCIAAGVDI
ncbi:uncharacterized protein BJX67DRAFT_368006 [Aspergillus lucknowensis]|uniref:Extracellular membrane protein CFEM domain-containing protein n=1 Tax=Aspergillus lucknowensis TaxID=176173 RepID=A0ABR4LB77_9EURO